ncbi:LANO_0F03202g1_1 [Lachancea nothofagi CBS 11611]|uniref:LANO_0F03202g1_1 n=1 Tax=Lachancea nothofagi CBS 11611 TaxID=1266666 RepID=A0A1G4K704_9SACH|nr:LANO_0F03202g1_1 [Lachancea nothofagi CBS 11611]
MVHWDHIVYQDGNTNFYIPILFGHSPTFGQVVPCFVGDVIRGYKLWTMVIKRYYPSLNNTWLYNNYPVETITILGCVVSCKWRFIGGIDFALFKIDDCTRETLRAPSLLNCKCSKSLILRSGLPQGDLSGWRFKLSGVMNRYEELEVRSIDICSSVSQEVEFWKNAMQWRSILSDVWTVDQRTIEFVFSQEDSQNVSSSYDFVQRLERQAYDRDLQIGDGGESTQIQMDIQLPFDHDSLKTVLEEKQDHLAAKSAIAIEDRGFDEKGISESSSRIECGDERDTLDRHGAEINYTSQEQSQGNGPRVPALPHATLDEVNIMGYTKELDSISLNDYRKLMLEHFLSQNAIEISTLNTFRNPTLYAAVRSLATGRTRSVEEEASFYFTQVLERYVNVGLIGIFAQGRILNLKTIKACDKYVAQRVAALVALGMNTGKIDFRKTADDLRIACNKSSSQILLALHKRALQKIVETGDTNLAAWWLELINNRCAIIRFEYARRGEG